MPPQSRLPRSVYRFEVEVSDVADLTGDGVLEEHGIERLAPTRRQWAMTQPIGESYWRAGRRGILVPSAAHVDGHVLVVFRTTAGRPEGVNALPRPRRYTELPALPTGLRT